MSQTSRPPFAIAWCSGAGPGLLRPLSLPSSGRESGTISPSWQAQEKRRSDYHLFWPGKPYKEDYSILIAGCGTSQAAKHALRWPKAQVTGIDVSGTSVRCTEELKRKYNLANLQVRQFPIDRLSDLGTTFDQIVCTGVLHHLADPDAGLAADAAYSSRTEPCT